MVLVYEHFKQAENKNFLKEGSAVFFLDPSKNIHALVGGQSNEIVITPDTSSPSAEDLANKIKDLADTLILIAPQQFIESEHNVANMLNDLLFLDEMCHILLKTFKKNILVHTSVLHADMRMNQDKRIKTHLYEYLKELLNHNQISQSDGSAITWFKFFNSKKFPHKPICKNNQPSFFVFDAPVMNNLDIFDDTHITPLEAKNQIGFYLKEDEILNCNFPALNIEHNYKDYKITEALHFFKRTINWSRVCILDFKCYVGDITIGNSVFGFIDDENQTFGNVEPFRSTAKFPKLNEITIKSIQGHVEIGEAAFYSEEKICNNNLWIEVQTLDLLSVDYVGRRAFESRVLYGSNNAWCNVKTLNLPTVKEVNASFRSHGKKENNAWQNVICLTFSAGMKVTSNNFEEAFKSCGYINNAWESVKRIRFLGTNTGNLDRQILNAAFENANWMGNIQKGPWDELETVDFSCDHLFFENDQWNLEEIDALTIEFPNQFFKKIGNTLELRGTIKNNKNPTKLFVFASDNGKSVFCHEEIITNNEFIITKDIGTTEIVVFNFALIDSSCNYGEIPNVKTFIDLTPPEVECFTLQINNIQPILLGFVDDEGSGIQDLIVSITGPNFNKSFSLQNGEINLDLGIWTLDFAVQNEILPIGAYLMTVNAIDRNNNQTTCNTNIIVDDSLPFIEIEPIQFPSNSAIIILRGSAPIGSTLKIKIDGGDAIDVIVNDDGSFIFETPPLSFGRHNFQFILEKDGKTTIIPFATFIDPNVPTLEVTSVENNQYINTPNLTLQGMISDPLSTINVNGQPAQINPDGTWFANLVLDEGENRITIVAVDSTGKLTTFTLFINVDSIPPAAPEILAIVDGNNQVITSGSIITSNQITFSGSTEPNIKVQILDGTTVIGETVSDNTGNWTIQIDNLEDRTYNLNFVSVDLAGNTTTSIFLFTIIIDTNPPAIPTFDEIDGATQNLITVNQTPTLKGSYEAGDTIELTVEINETGSTNIQTFSSQNGDIILDTINNTWSFTVPSALSFADYDIAIIAKDPGGNTATLQTNFQVCAFDVELTDITTEGFVVINLTLKNCIPNSIEPHLPSCASNEFDIIQNGLAYTLTLQNSCVDKLPTETIFVGASPRQLPIVTILFKFGTATITKKYAVI